MRLKSQKAKLKSRGLSGIGKLLMYGERFLEKETAVLELKEQVGFCSGEWEDDFVLFCFFWEDVTGHSRSCLDMWCGWTGNMGVG